MKKVILIICLVLVIMMSGMVFAEEDFALSFSFGTIWKSKYIAPNGENLHDDPVIQSSITISGIKLFDMPGFYVNTWHSGEVGSRFFDRKNGFASEIDYTLGWTGKLGEFDVDTGISYWDIGNLYDKDIDLVFSYFKLSKTYELCENQKLMPYIKPVGYLLTNGSSCDGFNLYSGLFHEIQINEKLCIDSEATLIYDDGVFFGDDGFLGKLGTCLSWKVSDNITIMAPSLELYTPLEHLKNDCRETELVLGFGANFKF